MHYHKDPWIWRATTYTYDRKALVFEPNSFYIFLYMFLHISFAPIMAMTNLNTTKPRWIDTCFVGVFPPWNNRPWSLIKSATQCHYHLGMVEKSHQNGDDLAFGVDPILVISSMAKKHKKTNPKSTGRAHDHGVRLVMACSWFSGSGWKFKARFGSLVYSNMHSSDSSSIFWTPSGWQIGDK